MRFEIVTVGVVDNKSKMASCAAVIECVVGGVKKFRRTLAFGLGKATLNLAALQATRIALMSLRQEVMQEKPEIILQMDNKYVYSLFIKDEAGAYKITPKVNQDVVASVRDWYEKAGRVIPMCCNYRAGDSISSSACVERAKLVAAKQVGYDSGTEEIYNVGESNR